MWVAGGRAPMRWTRTARVQRLEVAKGGRGPMGAANQTQGTKYAACRLIGVKDDDGFRGADIEIISVNMMWSVTLLT
jgi:hypothetical protein